MVHELAHGSENDSTYKDTVKQVETYLNEKGTDIDQYKQKIKDAYAKKGIELTDDGLKQEMVSKFLEENVYKSEADVMDMAFKNPSLAQKIYDGISNTVAKVGAGKATKALINAKVNFEKALNELPNMKLADGSLQYKVADEDGNANQEIDTDNELSENKQVSNGAVDNVNQSDNKENTDNTDKDTSNVNSDGNYGSEQDNSNQGIANDSEVEYKGYNNIYKHKIIKQLSAEDVNNWWKLDNPPYKPETIVEHTELKIKSKYARVYDGEFSNKIGGWILKSEDIAGLTPEQIKDKYALPYTPKYICDVELQAGTQLRTGIANEIKGWGEGGGIQSDLMGQITGDFINERLLK